MKKLSYFVGAMPTNYKDENGGLYIWRQPAVGWRFVHNCRLSGASLVGDIYVNQHEIMSALHDYAQQWGYKAKRRT